MQISIGLSLRSSTALGPVESFTVAQLFASGEEGAWYEPSTTTAFLSTTDLTPCGYGDGCGFLLDKSKGAGYASGSFTGLGSELVANGTFDADLTGWSILLGSGGSVSWVSGKARVQDTTAGTGSVFLGRAITTEVGKVYIVSGNATSFVNTSAALYKSDNTSMNSNFVNSVFPSEGDHSFVFTATATTTYVGGSIYASGGTATADFDNISVRELPGNHATQVTAGARPILARVPEGGRRNLLEKTEQFDDAYWDAVLNATVTLSASELDPTGNSGTVYRLQASAGSTWWMAHSENIPNTTYTISFWVKSASGSNETFRLAMDSGVVLSGDLTATSSWQRFTLTGLASRTSDGFQGLLRDSADNAADLYIWGAQLEAGSTATAYQKVVDQYDITEAGVTSLEYLSFDGSDDFLDVGSGFSQADTDFFCGVDPGADAEWMMVSSNPGGSGFVVAQNGSTSASYFGGTGTPSTLVDGVLIGTTRDNLHDAATGQARVIEYQNLNLSTFGGAAFLGKFSSDGYRLDGKLFGIVFSEALTAEEITNTRAYLAARSGVTL